jgi:hypothetical protein
MVNATRSKKQEPEIVNTSCPLVVDFCSGEVLEPLPSARFRRVCKIDEFDRFASGEPVVITVAETARRIDCKPKTLYNWIETGKLRNEHGLRRLGPARWRIDWAIFKACFDRGEFAPCS